MRGIFTGIHVLFLVIVGKLHIVIYVLNVVELVKPVKHLLERFEFVGVERDKVLLLPPRRN